jgi:hypothetical protein
MPAWPTFRTTKRRLILSEAEDLLFNFCAEAWARSGHLRYGLPAIIPRPLPMASPSGLPCDFAGRSLLAIHRPMVQQPSRKRLGTSLRSDRCRISRTQHNEIALGRRYRRLPRHTHLLLSKSRIANGRIRTLIHSRSRSPSLGRFLQGKINHGPSQSARSIALRTA